MTEHYVCHEDLRIDRIVDTDGAGRLPDHGASLRTRVARNRSGGGLRRDDRGRATDSSTANASTVPRYNAAHFVSTAPIVKHSITEGIDLTMSPHAEDEKPIAAAPQAIGHSDRQALVSRLRTRFGNGNIPPFQLVFGGGLAERFGPAAGKSLFTVHVCTETGRKALHSLDQLKIAEAYVDGHLDLTGSFLSALDIRRYFSDWHPWYSIQRFLSPLVRGRVASDKRTVTQHYDYGNDLYFTFLDESGLYSQALYHSEQDSLEQAVRNKYDHVLNACRLHPGSHVLDVGAGWGSFSQYAAAHGVRVTMLTIARQQYRHLTELCAAPRHQGRLDVVFESIYAYDTRDRYDAIVILGVTEHLPDYPPLYRQLRKLLKPGGFIYQDFTAVRRKFAISSFTHRHVFPGRGSPVVLTELMAAANNEPFEIVAIHNDRHSYFLTVRDWARKLEAARQDISRRFGERTYRLFRLYLWATAHCLREGELESYRLVLQQAEGLASNQVGLFNGDHAHVSSIA
jgi:cyclopropane-fatty-acyl-phospholipid synthase